MWTMPIALPNFLGGTPEEQQYGLDIVTVIGSNLERSGLFRPLPQDDPTQRQPDIGLARANLGWEPKVQLDEGLRHTRCLLEE